MSTIGDSVQSVIMYSQSQCTVSHSVQSVAVHSQLQCTVSHSVQSVTGNETRPVSLLYVFVLYLFCSLALTVHIERFLFELETKAGELTEREPSFWSFDWFCKHSANARAILLDRVSGVLIGSANTQRMRVSSYWIEFLEF